MTSTAINTESIRSRNQASVVMSAERELSRARRSACRSTRAEISPCSGTGSSMFGCSLLIYKDKSERAGPPLANCWTNDLGFWLARLSVGCGASQLTLGAKPIVFGRALRVVAAGPQGMCQLG